MSYLSRYRQRINAKGTTIQKRIKREIHDNFYEYLARTPQQEQITRLNSGNEYTVSILTRRISATETFFQILAPLEMEEPLQQGVLLSWNNYIWIVFVAEDQRSEHHETYFRGEIKKCNHPLRWVDRFGKIREAYGYWKGNLRGDLRYQTTSNGFGSSFAFVYADITGDVEVIVPIDKHTKLLKEQDTFIMNDKAWELVDKDDFSYPGIIGLLLKRTMKDSIKDDMQKQLARVDRIGSWRLVIENGNESSMVIGQEQDLRINIYENDNLVTFNPPEWKYEISDSTVVSFDGITLRGLNHGSATLKISLVDAPDLFTEMNISIASVTDYIIHYSLEGNATIREGGRDYTYIAKRTYNGTEDIEVCFKFMIEGNMRQLVTVKQISKTTCRLITNRQGRFGNIKLIAYDESNEHREELNITVRSVL